MSKITDSKYVRKLFLLCWLVYCTSYIGRLNYSSAMAVLIGNHILTSSMAGMISMLYFFAYGIGQMINGVIGDRINPSKMILSGLLLSAAANFGMGFAGSFLPMAIIWGLNGYFQSMIWAPIIRIFAEMLTSRDQVNCSVNIASSGVVGTLLSYLLSAALLAILPWNSVFLSAALILVVVAAIFQVGFFDVLRYAGKYGSEENGKPETAIPENGRLAAVSAGDFKSAVLTSGIFFLLIPIIIHGMLKDGVTAWVPTYISGKFGISAAFSVLLTTILPIINLAGAYMGKWIYLRCKKNVGLSNAIFFILASVSLALLFFAGSVSAIFTLLLLAVITCSMMAINTLSINVYPLQFEKYGRVSSTSGFLNAMAYLGTALSTYLIGVFVQYRGWDFTIFLWLLTAGLALILCLLAAAKMKEV